MLIVTCTDSNADRTAAPARPRPAGHPAPIMVIGVIDSFEEEHTALADDWLVTLSIADTAFLAFSERDFESGEAQPGYRRSVSDRPPTQPSAASKTPPARDGTPLPDRRSLASKCRSQLPPRSWSPRRSPRRDRRREEAEERERVLEGSSLGSRGPHRRRVDLARAFLEDDPPRGDDPTTFAQAELCPANRCCWA